MEDLALKTRKLVEKVIHSKCCLETYDQLIVLQGIDKNHKAYNHTLKINFESLVVTLAALLEREGDFKLYSIPKLLDESEFNQSSLFHIQEFFPEIITRNANEAISELRANASKEHSNSIKLLKAMRDKQVAHLEWTQEVIKTIDLKSVRSLVNYCSKVSYLLFQVNNPDSSTEDTISKRVAFSFVKLFSTESKCT